MATAFELYPFQVGEVLQLKKKHPCGSYNWRVVRAGADISLECLTCGHRAVMPRRQLEKTVKAVIPDGADTTGPTRR